MVAHSPGGALRLPDVQSVAQAGSKAFSLAELVRNGIPVPETVVIPPDCHDFFGGVILETLGGCVAVRSSATAEDLADASFAGQFKSFLNIRTTEELASAIRECRASVQGDAVHAYCAARGMDGSEIRMAVIVQRLVKASVAGVLFTVHPMTGREDEMLIEACAGLADGLLAGREAPVQIQVHENRPASATDLLSEEQIHELLETGRRIQQIKGSPQDIEWAIEEGRLHILQARPITRLCSGGIDGEWTNADFRDGGVSSDVVTPLVWSLYERVWERALKGFLRELRLMDADFEAARLFYGRPYWNLGAVKGCVRKLPGFVEREFDLDLAVQPSYSGDGTRTPASLWNVLKTVPTLRAARWTFHAQEARDRELLGADLSSWFALDPEGLGDPELIEGFAKLVEKVYLTVEENYFRTIFCASIAKMNLQASIRGLPVSYPRLVGGLDTLNHFAAVQALWEIANHGMRTPESFVARFGHHSRRELDLRVPRWSEDPAFVQELATKLVGAESPERLNQRQRLLCTEEQDRARHLLGPWRRRTFEKALGGLRGFLWLREQMRDLSTQVYAVIRRFVLEIGRRAAARGRLDAPDDVFYLTFREIYPALELPQQAVVKPRRDHERRYRNFHPPNEVGRRFSTRPVAHTGTRLTGIGCSPGVASGPVQVVARLENASRFQPGAVLVCPYTDPGWTPLLGIAGAVVTETGGLLSHAAVICREYGIPAVLNVPRATRILRDGKTVRVDGENGHVDLC